MEWLKQQNIFSRSSGGLRSEDQYAWVLLGARSSWLIVGQLLPVSSSLLICLLKTVSPATGTWWGRALTYEWGDPTQPVAMYNFSTVVSKGYLPCCCIAILVHDSEVEKYFIKITFLQLTFTQFYHSVMQFQNLLSLEKLFLSRLKFSILPAKLDMI